MIKTEAIKKNLKFDMLAYILTQLFTFFNKYIFIRYLGEELLGLNSLFISILSIISLADLGIGNVFVVHLYKPLKENNQQSISASFNYFRKIYGYIILVVLIIGLIFIPFLPMIIEVQISNYQLIMYYLLYFTSVLVTYFSMCYNALLHADQKHYVISKYNSYILLIQNIIQFVLLIIFQRYDIFLAIQIFTACLYNFLIKKYVNKNYDYFDRNANLEKKEKKKIFTNTKDMILYKTSCVMLNATDNLLIANIVNVAAVGLYSIYTLLTTFINSVLSVVSTSLSATIGEISVGNAKEEKYSIYKKLQFFYDIFAGLCFVGLIIGSNDFISIIFGDIYSFSFNILLIIVLNFYLLQITQPIFLFRENAGFFKEVKYIMIICAILNIALSIILGKMFGLFGILAATFISKMTTTFWLEAKIVYKKLFGLNVMEYYKNVFKNAIILFIIVICCLFITSFIKGVNIYNFIIKEIISCLIYCSIIFILHRNSDEFKFYFKILTNIKRRRK